MPDEAVVEFETVKPGRFYLPIGDLPEEYQPNSEYFLIFVHDINGDLAGLYDPGPDDLVAIHGSGPGNLDYGTFTVFSGTPVTPDSQYRDHHL